MSGRGRPSKGCERCRSRKVKCDETAPSCKRCQKSNHECVYRDDFERVHRDQISLATRLARDRWRERAVKSDEPASSTASSSDDDEAPVEFIRGLFCPLMKVSPRKSLQPTMEQQAYLRFCYDFVSPMDIGGPQSNALDLLPRMYSTSSPDSCLHFAAMAVSCANFGSRFGFIEARRAGVEHYGRALRLAAAVADNPAKMQSKQTILAIHLLAMYEVLSTKELDGSWDAHLDGCESILSLRGSRPFRNATKNGFFGRIYIQMVPSSQPHPFPFTEPQLTLQRLIKHMGFETQPPAHLNRSLDLFPPSTPEISLAELLFQSASVCAKLKQQQTSTSPTTDPSVTPSTQEENLHLARELDAQLETWSQTLPQRWKISTHRIVLDTDHPRPAWVSTLLNAPGAPTVTHRYANPAVAMFWNLYRVARMQLKCAMLSSSPIISPLEDTSALVTNILAVVDEIFTSVPAIMGIKADGEGDPATAEEICGMRGYWLMFPLLICLRVVWRQDVRIGRADGLDWGRRSWVKVALMFLSGSLGVRKAEAYL